MEELLPERVGPYLIDRKIGSGGMGNVYLGRHAETEAEAAVKVLPASLAREEGFVLRFSREVDAMRSLSSPYIVKLFESGLDGETYYYAMEYVDGETLTARLRRERRIPWREAIEIASQICAALKAAHDSGVIHRDLKPSNLLLTRDGTVKLTDFGVAQVFAGGKLTATGGIIGTAEFMSPEQAQGQRATKRSDLYSLGAVMYAMVTGRPPFSGKTGVEVLQKHKFGQFDRPATIVPELPHWLDEIICQLLEKDPAKRFPDAFVLNRRLQEVIKKVELRESANATVVDGGDGSEGDDFDATKVPGADEGPGGATLMRDLVRHEIAKEQQPTPLEAFFNNVWVLTAMLVLLILGGVYWFRSRQLTPAERFAAGAELMEREPGGEWLTARDEYFQPLLDADRERWRPKVAPYLERIDVYELERRLGLTQTRLGRTEPESEVERLLLLAAHHRDAGDLVAAREALQALDVLLAGNPRFERHHRLVQKQLAELAAQEADFADRFGWLQQALDRAAECAARGDVDAARAIWQSTVALYGDDPAAAEQVLLARRRLKTIPEKDHPPE